MSASRAEVAVTAALLFASGFAGLVYQVLWMRELGFLFGNASHAVATALAAFFLGIAAGGACFGRLAERTRRPLLGYAGLEAAVALTAVFYFGLLGLFDALYEPLFAALGESRPAFVAAKFALSLLVLFPPAFFMGGTLPLMSQHLVRRRDALGATAALLYAVNTLGAALGAFAAPFVLVPALGVKGAYAAALATTLAVAVLAAPLGRRPAAEAPAPTMPRGSAPGGLRALAFLSGLATLALEVLWTRMFAQVLHNSVYTFAIILVTFLLALAAGAALARGLARRGTAPERALPALLLGGALLVAATPFLFYAYTDGLNGLAQDSGFAGYVLRVFGGVACVVGPATVWLGVLFPYLMKLAEGWGAAPGHTVGKLAALNTLGGVAGSLLAGFVLLEALGLWESIAWVAALYVGAGLATALPWPAPQRALAAALAALAFGAGATAAGSELPRVLLRPGHESLVQVLDGSAATVAVMRRDGALRLKHNNHYGLGGTGDRNQEARQAHWPLLLHPNPKRAFFLGLGTGITAGAALQHPLERVLVTELVAEVAQASREHFAPWLNGLFEDPRAEMRVEDGRNVLRGSRERYDVIVADLFLPWKAGVGSLYTLEHYRAARERLAPGGIYAQWLLLIQFSREEFLAVARSLVETFPRVTLWRANWRVTHPLVLLVGERDPAPLDAAALERRIQAVTRTRFDEAPVALESLAIPKDAANFMAGYQGNLTQARALLADAPVNTDDRPFVEYSAPVTHRGKRSGEASAFRYRELLAFYEAVFAAAPPERDPLLEKLTPEWRTLPRKGLAVYRERVLRWLGEPASERELSEAPGR